MDFFWTRLNEYYITAVASHTFTFFSLFSRSKKSLIIISTIGVQLSGVLCLSKFTICACLVSAFLV